jgi:transposase-like protein
MANKGAGDVKIESVGIGLDRTCMLMCEDGWREAMVGTIYDGEGECQHTIYLGATPEYGRKRFLERFEREVTQTKDRYPSATYAGIAGANIIPFFAFPSEIRRAIYTTNAIESMNSSLRKVIKSQQIFPSDEAAFKLVYLAMRNISKKWTMPIRDL